MRKRATSANIGFAKAGVTCFYDSLVLNQSAVLRLNICAKNPPLRQAAKRWLQPYPTTPATLGGGQDERLKNEPLLWLYYKKEIPYIHSGEKM